MLPKLEYVFTLQVDLAPPVDLEPTYSGDRHSIPNTEGNFDSPKMKGWILADGGNWNAVRNDGVVHLFAKYGIETGDGVVINVTNEGYGCTSQADMKDVFENNPKIASMGKMVLEVTGIPLRCQKRISPPKSEPR
jgi:hypothetical protein